MELISEFLGYLFIDVICYSLGISYVWVKNSGKKSFKQIRQETEELSAVGKSLIAKIFIGIMLLLVIGLLLTAMYAIFKFEI